MNWIGDAKPSWIYRLPRQLAIFLLVLCLVTSQINPCDATSVAMGSSVTFIALAMVIWILVEVDSVLIPNEQGSGKFFHWLSWSIAVFGVWLFYCTVLVPGRGNARLAYNGCWQWIAQGMLLLAVARLSMRSRVASPLCAMMLGCVAGTVAYACHQYFISMPAFRERFAMNPDSILDKMGLIAGSSGAMQFSNRLQSLEPTGPFALTNSLAGLMAAWLVFLFLLLGGQKAAFLTAHHSKGVIEQKWKWSSVILASVLMGSFFITLLLTKSRSGWLAAIVCLTVGSLLHPSIRRSGWSFANRFRIAIVAIATICVGAIGTVLVRDPTMLAEAGKSISYRFDYWKGAVAMIESRPWTGYGVANFQQNYNRFKVITASESPADPHNFVLETSAAGGLPLLLALVVVLSIIFLKTFHCSRIKHDEEAIPFQSSKHPVTNGRSALLSGGIAACISIFMSALLLSDDDTFYASVLFLGVGMLVFVLVERTKWIEYNERTVLVWLVSASVVFLHLFASGGWMQPGLMNSVCVFVGLAFGMDSGSSTAREPFTSRGNWIYPSIGVAVGILAIGDFARTTWFPVLGASGLMSSDSRNPFAKREPSEWLDMVQMDPFDPELPRMGAIQCLEELRRNDLSSMTRQKYLNWFEELSAAYIERDSNQWMPYIEVGKWLAILAEKELQTEGLNGVAISRKLLAYEYFSKAAEFYPNSALTRLQAAVGAAWCGKNAEARQQYEKAEQIDRETPHSDRKISGVVVFFPKQLENLDRPLGKDAWVAPASGDARGEPILRWLRTNVP